MAVFVRVPSDHCNSCDIGHAVRMRLERWIPEILRIMLLAGEEACIRSFGINRERQRERDLDNRSIGPLGLPLKIKHFRIADASCPKRFGIIGCALALQHKHCKPLFTGEEVAQKAAERERVRRMWLNQIGLTDIEQFHEKARELHDAVMRTPGVLVMRADGEANAPIKIRLRVEVANGVNNMIETTRGHRSSLNSRGHHFIAEKAVGTSN